MRERVFQLTIFFFIFGITFSSILITSYLIHTINEEEKLYGALSRSRILLTLKKKQDNYPVISRQINEVKMLKEVKLKIDFIYS